MNVCIPVTQDQGLQSPISLHFGSAPLFMIVNEESGAIETVANGDLHHQHGMCQPLAALAGKSVDALVVGGIGMGALTKLGDAGIRVFMAESGTVSDALDALRAGRLQEATPATACAHHGHAPHGQSAAGRGPVWLTRQR
jgi:predicted Fe-Mo cluster-binding NifX family protein